MINDQIAFAKDTVKLFQKVLELGLEFRYGEAWRTPFQAWANSLPAQTHMEAVTVNGQTIKYPESVGGVGSLRSPHINRLAIDIILHKHGSMSDKREDYFALGEYWKSLDIKNRWGDDIRKGDVYHFERHI